MLDTVLLLKVKLMYLKILNTKKKITPIIDKESTVVGMARESVTAGQRLIRRVDSSFVFGPKVILRIEKKRQGGKESFP